MDQGLLIMMERRRLIEILAKSPLMTSKMKRAGHGPSS